VRWKLEGRIFSGVEWVRGRGPAARKLRGVVSDISGGGLCLVTGDPPETSDPVQCVICVPQIPTGIPTLVQVRWIRTDRRAKTHRVGMQFLV
jgi:hypothetical protein